MDDWLVLVAKLEREDAAAQPSFVPVVVDELPSADAVEIEADGVIERLPADSSAIRILVVAACSPALCRRPGRSVSARSVTGWRRWWWSTSSAWTRTRVWRWFFVAESTAARSKVSTDLDFAPEKRQRRKREHGPR